ncbi:hypothetical protein [Methylomicrobium sp. Wu6]|nr:hypothetical protein [Methylomicrobium sp. Wu6]MEC4749578.1 hypothetical protein [Methylomicrobium sp. Wu6]
MAFDRASRWVYFTILTDNGKEFTDRFTAQGEREPSEKHPFD